MTASLPVALSASLLLTAALLPARRGEELDEDLRAAFSEALETRVPAMSQAEIDDRARSRVLAVTEEPDSTLEHARVFRAEDGLALAWVQLAEESVGASLVVLTDKAGFRAAAVLDDSLARTDEWQHFLKQLEFKAPPRLEGARPKSHLEEVLGREDDIAIEDEDARLTRALARLMGHMQDQASLMNLPRTGPVPSDEQLRLMHDAYQGVAALAADLEPILGEAKDEFLKHSVRSAGAAAAMRQALQRRDSTGARRSWSRITGSCKGCHELEGLAREGTLKDVSSSERDRLGIGDGYFVVGYDLRIAHPDRERAQALADGLRRAALLLDATR